VTAFHDAIAAMGSTLRASCGLSVTYHRGESSVQVTAVVGRTLYEADDASGAIVKAEARDYLIEAVALDFGAGTVRPEPGDRIWEPLAGGESADVYEVMPLGPEPCYRKSDPQGNVLRVHTKLIETGAAIE